MKYQVFTRVWWQNADPSEQWPNNLKPYANARRTNICVVDSEEEARKVCQEWNASHNPGKYSRKAEYQAIGR